jgi:shikimate kinase
MKISLIGYMGAGKTTVGKLLAEQLHLQFIDLDQEIEKESGYTISETVFNKGELFFRRKEREKLLAILEKDDFVLSVGGGTPCYYDNAELLNNNSLSVYLKYSVPELFKRLDGKQKDRPLIAHLDEKGLQEFIGKHLFERAEYYEKATLDVVGGDLSAEDICKNIVKLIHD